MRYFFVIALALALAGCARHSYVFQIDDTEPPVEHGLVNDHGSTQLAGIHNHGTFNVFVNSPGQVPMGSPGNPHSPGQGMGIKADEGLSLKPYVDQGDKLHIGYGRNLDDKGITKAEAEILFENDLAESRADLSENIFPGEWPDLPGPIKSVLINMRYQLGPGGFRGFGNMITAVRAHDWPAMAEEMKNSRWAEQTPGRAGWLIRVVEAIGREG